MSFPRYPAYKPSGVEWLGDVPEHWSVERVRWLCEIKKRISGELGHDVLSITQQGIKVKDLESNDGQLSMDYSKYQFVEVGDFAMNHMDLLTGYVDISAQRGVTSPDYRVFSIRDTSVCHDKYLLFLFQMGYKNKIFYAFGQGSSQLGRWRLPTEQFNDLRFPIPSHAEQTAIAAFLDRETGKIDALVAEQRRLMELLKEKRQAVISHAVTRGLNPKAKLKPSGTLWFDQIPSHWTCGPLKHFWEVIDCKHVTVPFLDEGIPVASIIEVRKFDLDLSQAEKTSEESFNLMIEGGRQPRRGDVIYCRNTANTGTSAYVGTDERIALGQDVCLIKSSGRSGRYLNYVLHSGFMKSELDTLMVGSTFKRINVAQIRGLMVPCPPVEEQNAIARHLDNVTTTFDTLTAEAQRAIDLLQERRTALISAAVTGQIDVRGLAPITLPAPRLHLHPSLHGPVPGAEEMQAFWRGADPADLPENPAVVVVMDWLNRMADVRGFEAALARLGLTHDQVMEEVFQPAENGDFRPLEQAHPLVLMQCLWRIGVQIGINGYHDMSGLILSDDFCAMNVFWATLRRKLVANDCQPPLVFETVGR
ncbi:MAG: restriction endonuclease subunit S [Prosthecobacter sp.]|jgi:type I restriction enzyme S subunit|uniref:restriction endonuclease subunit S n=1 Tax=Prosthecobacter sp. TaxID=1965333 RepID=UPI0019D9F880|nr:restriction endonuclease subunit S [Prosthecobacter sp.]MBE2283160.1 restriction endonuclease subunit S [Prosthecobacter sp.]